MEGGDSLRAHPGGDRRLLAAADSRLHPLSAPGGLIRLPPAPGKVKKVALVHDWLTGMRGGERCLEVFCELFPRADLFTLLHVPGRVSPVIENRRIVTSFVQRLPGAATRYRHYLPLFPAAIARFDLRGYDVVLSSSHCVAKAAPAPPRALHVCYCLTPMRYVWDMYDAYF